MQTLITVQHGKTMEQKPKKKKRQVILNFEPTSLLILWENTPKDGLLKVLLGTDSGVQGAPRPEPLFELTDNISRKQNNCKTATKRCKTTMKRRKTTTEICKTPRRRQKTATTMQKDHKETNSYQKKTKKDVVLCLFQSEGLAIMWEWWMSFNTSVSRGPFVP